MYCITARLHLLTDESLPTIHIQCSPLSVIYV